MLMCNRLGLLWRTTGKVLRWTQAHRPPLLAGAICTFAAGALTVFLARLLARAAATLPAIDIATWSALGVTVAGRAVLGFVGTYLLGLAAARAAMDLRQQLFARFMQAPVSYHDQSWSGDLVSALTSDALFIEQSLRGLLPALSQYLPTAALATVWLLVENWQLTAMLALAGLPLVAFAIVVGRALREITREGQSSLGRMAVVAQESLLGLRVIKGLSQERFFVGRLGDVAEKLLGVKRRRALWHALVDSVVPLGVTGAALCGVVIVQRQLASGQTSVEEVATLVAFSAVLGTCVLQLVKAYAGFENVVGAANRVLAVRPRTLEADDGSGPPMRVAAGEVAFEGVTFEYAAGRGGVYEINLRIGPGEAVALVGPNGAGKSTLIHLLMRFYRPQAGCVRLDGHAADDADLASWRRRLAVVTRDPAIFSTTVAENIRLGRDGASQADIERAARAVGLHHFILSLPEAYSAHVGESGVRLSAGQRQCLALARVFLQDPSVIVLDEATTSLDATSEAAFAAAMRTWVGHRTMIVISHRPDVSCAFTRVVRMARGRIVEDLRVPRVGAGIA